jgi:hypothetical protein
MDCFEYERFYVKKPNERLFLALYAVHTGKKKDFVKKCEDLRIHVKKCEFGSTVK